MAKVIGNAVVGWGSKVSPFTIYMSRGTKSKLRSVIKDYIKMYQPLIRSDYYTHIHDDVDPNGIYHLRAYVDILPHMPYRSQFVLNKLRKAGVERYVQHYDEYYELLEQSKSAGLPMLFINALRYGTGVPTVPFAFNITRPSLRIPLSQLTPVLCKNEEVLAKISKIENAFLKRFNKIVHHARIVGYLPRSIVRYPAILLNYLVLFTTLYPLAFYDRATPIEDELVREASSLLAWGVPFAKDHGTGRYYHDNIKPYSFLGYGMMGEPYILSHSAFNTSLLHSIQWYLGSRMFGEPIDPNSPHILISPLSDMLKFMIEHDLTVPDVVTFSYNPLIVEQIRRNGGNDIFHWVSSRFISASTMESFSAKKTTDTFEFDSKARRLLWLRYNHILGMALVEQATPRLISNDSLKQRIESYESMLDAPLLPEIKHALSENTIYIGPPGVRISEVIAEILSKAKESSSKTKQQDLYNTKEEL